MRPKRSVRLSWAILTLICSTFSRDALHAQTGHSQRARVLIALVGNLPNPALPSDVALIRTISSDPSSDIIFLATESADADALAGAVLQLLQIRALGVPANPRPYSFRVPRRTLPEKWAARELGRANYWVRSLRDAPIREIPVVGQARAIDLFLPKHSESVIRMKRGAK